jgi:hypothetical protein
MVLLVSLGLLSTPPVKKSVAGAATSTGLKMLVAKPAKLLNA